MLKVLWYPLCFLAAVSVGWMWFEWHQLLSRWRHADRKSWEAYGSPNWSWLSGWSDRPDQPESADQFLKYGVEKLENPEISEIARKVVVATRLSYLFGVLAIIWLGASFLQ